MDLNSEILFRTCLICLLSQTVITLDSIETNLGELNQRERGDASHRSDYG